MSLSVLSLPLFSAGWLRWLHTTCGRLQHTVHRN